MWEGLGLVGSEDERVNVIVIVRAAWVVQGQQRPLHRYCSSPQLCGMRFMTPCCGLFPGKNYMWLVPSGTMWHFWLPENSHKK